MKLDCKVGVRILLNIADNLCELGEVETVLI